MFIYPEEMSGGFAKEFDCKFYCKFVEINSRWKTFFLLST